ncbi:hypothetical protein PRIPAC_74311 [Pristionchus pacificus]|uniref:Uncharacterized protein n=1 Tax=Pristionchus pacificus TaxID=54126 RepID=A0A2A6C0Y9_PRIPA|nr:hypothetical protein PRIPAC_74311 [Pristionchus pacificus]|eukprot:PDM71683.1 hypothetical protein PRIPAC_38090 [Pristionchus pacificus]
MIIILLVLLLFLPAANAGCPYCGNPCPKCTNVTYTETNGTQCETLKCADGSYPTWASSDEDIETVETFNHQMFCTRITNWKDPVWMNKDSTVIVKRNQSITCNNFNIPKDTIKSICDSENLLCEKLTLDPYKINTCSGQVNYEYNGVTYQTQSIELEKKAGKWTAINDTLMTTDDQRHIGIDEEANAYCIYTCDKSKLFLSSEQCDGREQCVQPFSSQPWLFECPTNYNLWVIDRLDSSTFRSPTQQVVKCDRGKFKMDDSELAAAKCSTKVPIVNSIGETTAAIPIDSHNSQAAQQTDEKTSSTVDLSTVIAITAVLSLIILIVLICAIVLLIKVRGYQKANNLTSNATSLSSSKKIRSEGIVLDRNSTRKETWENRKSKERRRKAVEALRTTKVSVNTEKNDKEKKNVRPLYLKQESTLGSFDTGH